MFTFPISRRQDDRSTTRRPRSRRSPMVESLEGRQLLSTLPPVAIKKVVLASSLSHTVAPFIKHEPVAQFRVRVTVSPRLKRSAPSNRVSVTVSVTVGLPPQGRQEHCNTSSDSRRKRTTRSSAVVFAERGSRGRTVRSEVADRVRGRLADHRFKGDEDG